MEKSLPSHKASGFCFYRPLKPFKSKHYVQEAKKVNAGRIGEPTAMGVARNRSSVVTDIFGRRKVAIGVIHCPPLPGTPDYEGQSITAISDLACADAEAYVAGG